MTGAIQPQLHKELEQAYPPCADGPYVGKPCGREGCREVARYAITPTGRVPADHAKLACGRHMMSTCSAVIDVSGKSVVIQEIPRMVRYRQG